MNSKPTSTKDEAESQTAELLWLAAMLLIVGGVWVSTLSSGTGLGDAPESIAGAQVFGVLHAPGYILYSGVGWVAIRFLAFLSPDSAVTAVSLLASLGGVGLVFVTARLVGASPAAAAAGAGLFGLSTSVWFYAGYAKHTALTTLLVVGLVALTVRIGDSSSRGAAVWLGTLIGLSLGLGWPVAATVAPVSIWIVWKGLGPRGLLSLAGSTVAAVAVVSAVVLWRGSVSPAVNWGEVNSLGRLWDLVTMRDFGLLSSAESAEVSKEVGGSDLVGLPGTLWAFIRIVVRNLGIPAALLAFLGVLAGGWRRHWLMLTIAGVNLLAVSLILGVIDRGVESVLVMGGFTAPTLLAVAVMSAVGTDRLLAVSSRVVSVVAGLGLLVVIAGAVIARLPDVRQPAENLPLLYAEDVFAEIPANGMVVVWQAERSFPLSYAQVIHGLRTDVTVIASDGLHTEWYRDQLQERNRVDVAVNIDLRETTEETVANLVASGRSVHLDMWAWEVFRGHIPSRVLGVTAEAFPGSTEVTANVVDRVLVLANRPVLHDELFRSWPNEAVMTAYARSAIILAEQALATDDRESARRLLEAALRLDPENETVAIALETLDEG